MAERAQDTRWIVVSGNKGEKLNDGRSDNLKRRSESMLTLYTSASTAADERPDKHGLPRHEQPAESCERDTLKRHLSQQPQVQRTNTSSSQEQATIAVLQIPDPPTDIPFETRASASQKDPVAMNLSPSLLADWSRARSSRHMMLISRMQAQEQNSFCSEQRLYGRKLLDEMMTKLKTGLENEERGSEEFRQVLEMFQQIQDYQRELDTQEENARQLVNRLSSLEYQYGQDEERLFEKLQREVFHRVPEIPDETIPSLAQMMDSLANNRSSATMHPLLQEYYDRIGDIGVWRDRLDDLEATHRKTASSRETRRDHGQVISPSDIDFYDEYHRKKESILMEISRAEADSRRLREECKELSLDLSESELSGDGIEGELHAQSNDNPPKTAEQSHRLQDMQISDISLLSTGYSTVKDRIDHWLGEVNSESMTKASAENDSNLQHSPTGRGTEFEDAPSNDRLSREKQRSTSISIVDSADTAATSPPVSPAQDARSWRRPRTASSDSIIRSP